MSPEEEALKQTSILISELENQSDRGAAIVGVAWVEEELQAALQSYLEKDKKAWENLFGRSRPMSSFAAKIDLARLLGMCTEAIAKDLHVIRDIRNDFAHKIVSKDKGELSFKSQHISDRCLALQCVAHELIGEPRQAFVRACATLNSDFYLHRFFGSTVTQQTRIHAYGEGAV